jgi:hypothetical protein
MRKIEFAIIIALLLAVIPAKAQVGNLRNEFSVGFAGGAGTSSVSFVPTIKQTFSPGITGGLVLRYTSEKYFWLVSATQLEVNFSQRGWTELIEDGSGNEYTRVINYVEIPFLTHLGVGREYRGFQGYLNLGPQIGFSLGDKEYYGGKLPWDVTHRPNNVVEQYGKALDKKFEYGITGGIGVELKTGIGTFGLEGRYYFGLSDIFNNSKKDYFARSANSTISVRAAYMFSVTR